MDLFLRSKALHLLFEMLSDRYPIVYQIIEFFSVVQVDTLQPHEPAYVAHLLGDHFDEFGGCHVCAFHFGFISY